MAQAVSSTLWYGLFRVLCMCLTEWCKAWPHPYPIARSVGTQYFRNTCITCNMLWAHVHTHSSWSQLQGAPPNITYIDMCTLGCIMQRTHVHMYSTMVHTALISSSLYYKCQKLGVEDWEQDWLISRPNLYACLYISISQITHSYTDSFHPMYHPPQCAYLCLMKTAI